LTERGLDKPLNQIRQYSSQENTDCCIVAQGFHTH